MSDETRAPVLWTNGLGQRRWQPRRADGLHAWAGELGHVWTVDNGRHPALYRFRWHAVRVAVAAERYQARLDWQRQAPRPDNGGQ